MNAPDVLWMRHGTSADGITNPQAHAMPDSALHAQGVAEIRASCGVLLTIGWRPSIILTSPLQRAAASALVAADVFGAVPVEHLACLREWCAPRCVRGRAPEDYPPEYLTWRTARLHHHDLALEDGESLRAVRDRAAAVRLTVAQFAARHGRVLAVSHLVLIGCVKALSEGFADPAEIFTNASRTVLPPAGTWPSATPAARSPASPRRQAPPSSPR